MIRAFLPLAPLLFLLPACTPAAPPATIPMAAPTPVAAASAPASAALVLRRCDDGGDGGVLIDGICL